jgi:hypothetical protein
MGHEFLFRNLREVPDLRDLLPLNGRIFFSRNVTLCVITEVYPIIIGVNLRVPFCGNRQ